MATPQKTAEAKTAWNQRFLSLKSEAEQFKPSWRSLSTYIDPTRGIFDGDRTKIGQPIDHETLLDSHATFARDTCASGMQTGLSDPARPWFNIELDDWLMEIDSVRLWLDEVDRRMQSVMNRSNIYEVLHTCYKEITQFGTACFLLLEDMDDVIRGRSLTCGEYYLGVDCKGRVNAFAREFEMTVEQIVEQFGYESCSMTVKADWDNDKRDKTHKVRHLVEENKHRDGAMADFQNMPFRSIYWEAASGDDAVLGRRGFKRFPVIAPRWETLTTEMVYGYCPGTHAIGDIKELQVTHEDMLTAQEKLGNPPLQKDSNVQGNVANVPGGVTTVSANVPNAGVRPLYQVDPRLDSFVMSIDRLHKKIDRFFFADLFLMINSLDSLGSNPEKTATEITERRAEKMMMLGPIIHKLTEELHNPLIEAVFTIMYEQSENMWGTELEAQALFPAPPQEIEGHELKIRYISILAQAQRSLGSSAIEKILGIASNSEVLNAFPSAPNAINIYEVLRIIGENEGVPQKCMNDQEVIDEIEEQQAKQQALAAGMEMAEQGTKAVKNLAGSQMKDPSALSGLMQGYK